MYDVPDFSALHEFVSTVEGILTFLIGLNVATAVSVFVIAYRIGIIKSTLTQKGTENDYQSIYAKGELREFQGKKSDAIDCYMEALFLVNKTIAANPTQKEIKNKETIRARIISLGGNVPN
jgi:hypothetical protein